MASNLTNQVRSIASVTKAVAAGDLSQKVDVDVQGEMLDLKRTVNNMTDQLNVFAREVNRYASLVNGFFSRANLEKDSHEKSERKVSWAVKPMWLMSGEPGKSL